MVAQERDLDAYLDLAGCDGEERERALALAPEDRTARYGWYVLRKPGLLIEPRHRPAQCALERGSAQPGRRLSGRSVTAAGRNEPVRMRTTRGCCSTQIGPGTETRHAPGCSARPVLRQPRSAEALRPRRRPDLAADSA